MEEAWNYVWVLYGKTKQPVPEHVIIHFLRERVPAHAINKVLDVMVRSRMLIIQMTEKSFAGYKPASKEARLTGAD
jgi:hypothetical protein